IATWAERTEASPSSWRSAVSASISRRRVRGASPKRPSRSCWACAAAMTFQTAISDTRPIAITSNKTTPVMAPSSPGRAEPAPRDGPRTRRSCHDQRTAGVGACRKRAIRAEDDLRPSRGRASTGAHRATGRDMSDHHAAEHHGADHHASEHHASEHHASEHQVVIAGGGPTGMMLSAELALAGAEVVIVEPRPDQHLDGSRAGGLHARTIEVLDQRGVADRFLAAGRVMQVQGFAGIPLDISDFPTRHPYGLALWQADFEPILAEWVAELGVPTLREVEVVGFEDDGEGVTTRLSDGRFLRSAYLVGCDGGRSLVRRTAGIEFVGTEPTRCWLLAEVEFDDTPQLGMRPEGGGIGPVNIGSEGGPYRVVLVEDPAAADAEAPDLEFVRESLVGLYGSDFGLRSASWVTRFSDQARQAAAYRAGRVLLA